MQFYVFENKNEIHYFIRNEIFDKALVFDKLFVLIGVYQSNSTLFFIGNNKFQVKFGEINYGNATKIEYFPFKVKNKFLTDKTLLKFESRKSFLKKF